MTDKQHDVPERTDPVLVRPYVETETDGTTWPENATLPAEEPDDTVVLEAALADDPPPPRRRGGLRRIVALRLLALLGGVLIALGIVGFMLSGPDDEAPLGPRAQLPAPAAPTRTEAAPRKSAVATRRTKTSKPTPPSTAPASHATSAPAADRTGAITAASGRCLALGGLLALDGNPIVTAACSGGTAQQFTLATDGTLRVAGRCAQTTGDGTVRVIGCDDRAAARWRPGPGGALVNPASGDCLTDPGRDGATRATACTGATDQRWALP